MDENINISLPIFAIHGNHDEPSGVRVTITIFPLSQPYSVVLNSVLYFMGLYFSLCGDECV